MLHIEKRDESCAGADGLSDDGRGDDWSRVGGGSRGRYDGGVGDGSLVVVVTGHGLGALDGEVAHAGHGGGALAGREHAVANLLGGEEVREVGDVGDLKDGREGGAGLDTGGSDGCERGGGRCGRCGDGDGGGDLDGLADGCLDGRASRDQGAAGEEGGGEEAD